MKTIRRLIALVLFTILTACGGGGENEPQATSQVASRAVPLRAPLDLYNGVDPRVAAEQLFAYGQATYPQYFAGNPTTQDFGVVRYRAYPGGVYLGVAIGVQFGDGLTESGVYTIIPSLWGPDVMVYVGHLLDFITPTTGGTGTGQFALSVATGYPQYTVINGGVMVTLVIASNRALAPTATGIVGGTIMVTPTTGVSPAFSVGYNDVEKKSVRIQFAAPHGMAYVVGVNFPDTTGATATLQVPLTAP